MEKNEFGNTMSFVFIGEGNIAEHYGSNPMSIKWELNEPLPPYLWKAEYYDETWEYLTIIGITIL